MTEKVFEVYGLFDSSNRQPFYIGKGSDSRKFEHEREAIKGTKSPTCDKINAIKMAGGWINYTVFGIFPDDAAAKAEERALIDKYTAMGVPLTNQINGNGVPTDPWGKLTRQLAIKKKTSMRKGAPKWTYRWPATDKELIRVWDLVADDDPGKWGLPQLIMDFVKRFIESKIGLGKSSQEWAAVKINVDPLIDANREFCVNKFGSEQEARNQISRTLSKLSIYDLPGNDRYRGYGFLDREKYSQ